MQCKNGHSSRSYFLYVYHGLCVDPAKKKKIVVFFLYTLWADKASPGRFNRLTVTSNNHFDLFVVEFFGCTAVYAECFCVLNFGGEETLFLFLSAIVSDVFHYRPISSRHRHRHHHDYIAATSERFLSFEQQQHWVSWVLLSVLGKFIAFH